MVMTFTTVRSRLVMAITAENNIINNNNNKQKTIKDFKKMHMKTNGGKKQHINKIYCNSRKT